MAEIMDDTGRLTTSIHFNNWIVEGKKFKKTSDFYKINSYFKELPLNEKSHAQLNLSKSILTIDLKH